MFLSEVINPLSHMIFYELKIWKIVVAYAFKRPSHGPMETPMRCLKIAR